MKFFERLNPYPVLLYFISSAVLATVYNNPYHTVILLVFSLITFIMIHGKARFALIFFSVFILTFIINPLLSKKGATQIAFIGNDPVTLEAVVYGANSAALICGIMFLFYCFSYIIDFEKLLYIFSPLSASAALTASAVLRFAPLYAKQAKVISDQQKAVGAEGGKSIPEKIKFGARVFSALSTWALENGIVAADSMQCRGYGTGKRRFFSIRGFKAEDAVFTALALLFTLGTVIFSLFTKCSFNYYPNIEIPEINLFFILSAACYTALVMLPLAAEICDMVRWKFLMQKI